MTITTVTGYMSAIDLPITKAHHRIEGADHTYSEVRWSTEETEG